MIDKLYFNKVKKILSRRLDFKKYKIFVFGSRAEATARKFSDVDIGIEGKESLPAKIKIELEEDLEDSDIPYTVDLVDFTKVSEKFKTIAKKSIKLLK